MTSQEKKAELLKYREAEMEATRLEGEITRWYSRSEKMTTMVKLVPGGSSGGRSIETAVEAIDDLAGQLGAQREKLVSMRKAIGAAIEDVDDEKLRKVLRLKYIEGMTWERVAESMDMSVRGVTKMHGRALAKINVSSL